MFMGQVVPWLCEKIKGFILEAMGIAAQCLHGVRVCVIPRPENGFKPLALHRRPLAVVAGILLITKALALATIALTPLPAELSTITSARIVQLTNQERARTGLNELTVNDLLTEAARKKAQDMLDKDYFAHVSPSGVTPWFWMSKVSYSYQVAGENLAIDFVEAENVVAAWMVSPTHRDNILHPDYIETGVAALTGEFEGGTSTVVVHMFGLPQGAQAPVQEPVPTGAPAVAPAVTSETPKSAPVAAAPAVPEVIVLGHDLLDRQAGNTIQGELKLQIEGAPGITVSVLVNNQTQAKRTLDAVGISKLTLLLSDFPDGEIVVKAFAENAAGRRSGYSASQVFIKDTKGPQVEKEALAFIASPATDEPVAWLRVPEGDYTSVGVTTGEEQLIYDPEEAVVVSLGKIATLVLSDAVGNVQVISDLTLAPSFYTERDTMYLENPARFSGLAQRVALTVAIVVLLLLTLAIVIRINIQHPRMIARASLIVLLALIMLFI